jgi:hypothetical protein
MMLANLRRTEVLSWPRRPERWPIGQKAQAKAQYNVSVKVANAGLDRAFWAK